MIKEYERLRFFAPLRMTRVYYYTLPIISTETSDSECSGEIQAKPH